MLERLSKMLAVIIALTMVVGAFAVLIPYSGLSVAPAGEDFADPIGMDMGPQIRAESLDVEEMIASAPSESVLVPSQMNNYYIINDTAWYYTSGYGADYWMTFTKRAEGNYCELWTADDMTFPSGDSRNAYTSRITITDDQAVYMVDQFDTVIYPTETEYFSDAPPLNGSDGLIGDIFGEADRYRTNDTGKVMIMVLNIADTNYYNPSYPYYIVGFYTGSSPLYYDRNIIHIDCWDWENRTGVQSDIPGSGHYSYVYESTVAHEYQHLLHDYVDPNEESWINEGCSMYAEALCGYGYSYNHIAHFFYTPDNSLTVWEDQGNINVLADYGASLIFMIYLNDHFGGSEMITTIMQSTETGTQSITDALHALGYNRWNFNKVFEAWRIANLLWTDDIGNGYYNYNSIELADIDQDIMYKEYEADWGLGYRSWWGESETMEGYSVTSDLIYAYGTDYIHVDGSDWAELIKITSKFYFDGDSIAQKGWEYYGDYWYSDTGDEIDYMLTMNVDLTGESVLAPPPWNYTHWMNITWEYDIEEEWDFAFVQVSTDGGLTWESLNDTLGRATYEEAGTMERIVENLPGYTGYFEGGMTFNLSAYAGQEIMIGFRYMTDWGTHYDGVWLSEVSIDGTEIDLESLSPVVFPVDYSIMIYAPANGIVGPMLVRMPTNWNTDIGQRMLGMFSLHDEIIIIVSPNEGPVDYLLGIIPRGYSMYI